ncbi:hypothetical protein GCK72_020475 [Caenorhabditis remanei]|uniref:NR LBD domain-containing protein n=1 Tax=Caenorhabditis remanei TaxID=31234 RepID=A0A6A5GFE1_CAERE|nr:hypothetical protein GCK72_020475 [Caenorhabditis remanei]KAF1753918.1 hypothetical protein GCK72_020475 [Caenorhabditis remanei]
MFFLRSGHARKMKKCKKQCKEDADPIRFCRSCRLQKCINAGMVFEEFGCSLKPRKPTKKLPKIIEVDSQFNCFVQLQTSQWDTNQKYTVCSSDVGAAKISQKLYRPATPFDINLSLHIGFRNAIDWANRIDTFRGLNSREKKCVTGEFGVGFILIDQAFKNAQKPFAEDTWFLQNDTYISDNSKLMDITSQEESRNRYEFIQELLLMLKKPFQDLKIDAIECVLLKILLLLTRSSTPYKNSDVDSQDRVNH